MSAIEVKRNKTQEVANFDLALKNMGENKNVGKVGWLTGAQYIKNRAQIAYVATIQEYGSPKNNIPPRPFMRPTISKKQNKWKQIALNSAKEIIKNGGSPDIILERVGLQAAGDIREAITQLTTPKLKESTVQARARKTKSGEITKSLRKPLVDTGAMLNSLTNSVGDE